MTTDTIALNGSIRWAFNVGEWNPDEDQWLLASQCVPLEEKLRIQKFVFKSDAKASMAGCLMIRKLVHLATGEPYNKINIVRDIRGRPTLVDQQFPLDFNVSHQGNFTVLAGEVRSDMMVGVDIMNIQQKPQHELLELFRLMNSSFSNYEWKSILASNLNEDRSAMFFRHWCLKESYFKATGLGICTDLLSVSFKVKSKLIRTGKPCTDTVAFVNNLKTSTWVFHEWLLDPDHCVSVALSPRFTSPPVQPVPFSVLSWLDLVKEAEPILPADVNYCQIFMRKNEKAQK